MLPPILDVPELGRQRNGGFRVLGFKKLSFDTGGG
jgi:hypothetical protein